MFFVNKSREMLRSKKCHGFAHAKDLSVLCNDSVQAQFRGKTSVCVIANQ